MIAKLTGIIDSIYEDYLILDVHGVGYKVGASARTLAKLAAGSPLSMYIETVVREDAFLLYGFTEAEEQYWFGLLTGYVQGVGARVALSILSTLSPRELTLAIASGDKAALGKASGVGPKLAARLVTELKDKVKALGIAPVEKSGKDGKKGAVENAAMDEAISALVNLGYQRMHVMETVAGLLSENADHTTETLIKLSLKELGKR